jgi:hypothetical protein
MLVAMAFFLEYTAEGNVVGRVRISSADSEEAFLYAKDVLRGMNCLSAVLRCTESITGFYGAGGIVARYTRSQGWSR